MVKLPLINKYKNDIWCVIQYEHSQGFVFNLTLKCLNKKGCNPSSTNPDKSSMFTIMNAIASIMPQTSIYFLQLFCILVYYYNS